MVELDISLGHASFRVVPAGNASYWKKVQAGLWEPETATILDALIRPGTPFVDVGAWIGPVTLAAASLGATVTAFECDPVALARLHLNIAANPALAPRITVVPAGIVATDGPFVLRYFGELGNSQPSVMDAVERRDGIVPFDQAITVDGLDARRALAPWLTNPDALIKIDIEGAEYAVVSVLRDALRTARCRFSISFHPGNIVGQGGRPDTLMRSLATLHWMEAFWEYDWWSVSDGALVPLDKDACIARAWNPKHLRSVLFMRAHQNAPANPELVTIGATSL